MRKHGLNIVRLFETFVYMDITIIKIRLHPLAKDYLFQYYHVLRRIFSNVLGQLETDYLSIAVLDKLGQLILFSSKPSIEQNLIDKGLLKYDACFQARFFYQDKPSLWTDLYCNEYKKPLYQYKQTEPALEAGIAIPTDFGEYRVLFSFGFKSINTLMQGELLSQREKLLAIGRYCLREILNAVPLPQHNKISAAKPYLKLIINHNLVPYEQTIR